MRVFMKYCSIIFILTLFLSACSDKKESNNDISIEDDNLGCKYSVSEITFQDSDMVTNLKYCKNTGNYIACKYDLSSQNKSITELYAYDENFEQDEFIDIGLKKNERITKWDADIFGNIALLVSSVAEHKNEYDEIIREKTQFVAYYDSDKKNLSVIDNVKLEDDVIMITDLFLIDDNIFLNLYNCDTGLNEFYTISKSGEEKSLYEFIHAEQIADIEKYESGVAVLYYDDEKLYICKYNFNNQCIEDTLELPYKNEKVNLVRNDEENEIYFVTTSYIIKKSANNNFENICNLNSLGFSGNNIASIELLPNKSFVFFEQDISTNNNYIYMLSESNDHSESTRQSITLAVGWMDEITRSKISKFNRSSEKYKVVVKDYSKYDETENSVSASTKLAMEFLGNEAPDVVLYTSFENGKVLENLGAFADIYEFIDSDLEINKSDFNLNILSNFENNGKLYSMPVDFTIETVVGLSEFVGDEANWNYDELIRCYNELAVEIKLLSDNTRENILDSLFYNGLDSYIDYSKKECSLDSDQIINFLKFVSSFENQDHSDGSVSDILEKKVLITNAYISTFDDFHELMAGYFGNQKATFVGFPTKYAKGTMISSDLQFSINNKSDNKDAAWNFIREFYTYDYQLQIEDAFPINKKAFDYIAKKSCGLRMDESGELKENIVDYGNGERNIGYITSDEVELLEQIISDMTMIPIYDATVYKICEEELAPFLNDLQTAEETAHRIDTRIELYLNEQS